MRESAQVTMNALVYQVDTPLRRRLKRPM